MSRSQTVYCGPYAQFEYPHKSEPEAWERCETCMIERRRHYGTKTLFCGACGTKFIPVERMGSVRPDVFQALGETDRMRELYLNDIGRVLCVGPNMHGCGRYLAPYVCGQRDVHKEGYLAPLDITSVDIEAEKQSFRELYHEDLVKLSAEYGEVAICWGVHTWTS